MTGEMIARALGGRKSGSGYVARCPAHDDRSPSLSLRAAEDGMVLFHCHAGCPQEDVLDALRRRGLWPQFGHRRDDGHFNRANQVARSSSDQGNENRSEAALRIWKASINAAGTPAETYLRQRGLGLPASTDLRFHAGLRHPSGEPWPALVALVRQGTNDRPVAIHRTFLARDGSGKAPVEPQKMMLGPVRGGAVRLSEAGPHLLVGEGIESTLSAMIASDLQGWAGLSAGGIKSMELPPLPLAATVTIAADPDPIGQASALDAADRWHAEGRIVRMATPPPGRDFNDLIREENIDG